MRAAARSPLAALRELSAAEATGELICAAPALEAHIYLQEGRIAWATSSASRYAFGRDLIRRSGIDQRDFREVVETCRRERRPLGETLVQWGLSTTEDVRASLEAQIRDVMATLVSLRDAQTLFLERSERYRAYAAELTFDLDDVVEEEPVDEQALTLLGQTLEAVPEARWVEVLQEGRVVASHAKGDDHDSELAPSISAMAFGDGIDLLTVRSGLGTLVGFTPDGGSHRVVMGLGGETRLGAVSAAIARFAPGTPLPPARLGDGRASAEGSACEPCADALWEVVRRSDVIVAAQLRSARGGVFVLHRDTTAAERTQVIAARGQALLETPKLDGVLRNPQDTQVEMLGFHFRSAVFGEGEHWHFGAVVPDGSGRSVWLCLPRSVSQGLGWAISTATSRQLADVECRLEVAS